MSELQSLKDFDRIEELVRKELNETIKFINESNCLMNDDGNNDNEIWMHMEELTDNLMNVRQMRKEIGDTLRDTELFFNDVTNHGVSVEDVYNENEEKYEEMAAFRDDYYTETMDLIPGSSTRTIRTLELPRKRGRKKRSQNTSLIIDNGDNAFIVPIDPISRKPIEVPMRNIKCDHIYDNDSIRNYLNTIQKQTFQCPVSGCKNEIQCATKSLKLDQELYKKIIEFNAQVKMDFIEDDNDEEDGNDEEDDSDEE